MCSHTSDQHTYILALLDFLCGVYILCIFSVCKCIYRCLLAPRKRSHILGLKIPILFDFFAQVLFADTHFFPLSMILTFSCSQVYLFYRSFYVIFITLKGFRIGT